MRSKTLTILMVRRGLLALALVMVLGIPAAARGQAAGVAAPAEPDRKAIARAGRESLESFDKRAASWTVVDSLPPPSRSRFVVEVIRTPEAQRSVVRVEEGTKGVELFRFIARDGAWHVTEGPSEAKYRPYEAPFRVPAAYMHILRSDLRFVIDEETELGRFEALTDGVASYRTPLAAPIREHLESTARQLRSLKGSGGGRDAETARALERLQDLHDRGLTMKVDVRTGIIVQAGSAERQLEVRNFRWLDRAPEDALSVKGRAWKDVTSDPTEHGTKDLVIIGHSGVWSPGQKSGDVDGRLLDLRTGSLRRLPYEGAIAVSSCFLRDRTKVVVCGIDGMSGAFSLTELDLRTGENRRLGEDLFTAGVLLMPTASPDGRTVAVLHKGAKGDLLESRLCLIDLETGRGRALEPPRDMAFPSWMPDGKEILLLIRERARPDDPKATPVEAIVRLDVASGRIKRVVEGSFPTLVDGGKAILFQASKTRQWTLCDPDGGHVRRFLDGLPGHGFPAASPDGKDVLMMRFAPGQAPAPVIIPIDGGKRRPVLLPSGLWTMPAWR